MAKQIIDKATGFIKRNEIILEIPTSEIMQNPENRHGLGYDPMHVESLAGAMSQNGWLAGQSLLVTAIDPAQNGGKKWLLIEGNHRFPAAELAGLDTVPCRIREGGNEIQNYVNSIESNNCKGLSRLERMYHVHKMIDIFRKPAESVTHLFSGDPAAKSSQVSAALAFVRRCPAWLDVAVREGKISVTEAEKLVADNSKGRGKKAVCEISDEIKTQIESRNAETGTWKSIKPAKVKTAEELAAERLAIETRANEIAQQKIAADEEKAAKAQKAKDAKTASDKLAIDLANKTKEQDQEFVKQVADLLSLSADDDTDTAKDAFEALFDESFNGLAKTYGTVRVKNEIDRQNEARKNGASEGNANSGIVTPSDIAAQLDASGASENTPGQTESTSKPLTEEEKAKILANPTVNESITVKTGTQKNPDESHGKSVSIKRVGARFNAIVNALNAIKLPADSDAGTVSKFIDDHCFISPTGEACLRLSLGHATQRFIITLGSDMVN